MKTQTENTNRGQVYLYHKLIYEATFQFGFQFTDIYFRDLFDLNFVINKKVIFLHKVIKHVKGNKSSFDNFSAKHTALTIHNVFSSMVRKFNST